MDIKSSLKTSQRQLANSSIVPGVPTYVHGDTVGT